MRSLSVKQPWAMLLVKGIKTVEVRSWSTDYRGDLLICASAAPKNFFLDDETDNVRRLLPAGCIIGIVRLINIRKMQESDTEHAFVPFDDGAYAWEVEPVTFCRPDKIMGRLGLYDVPDEKIVRLTEPDWPFNYPPPQGKVKYTKACPLL